jgi:hypothetical protein
LILVTEHQNSPSNAHAYRLLIIKELQTTHQSPHRQSTHRLAPISDQHRSEIMTCFLQTRQALSNILFFSNLAFFATLPAFVSKNLLAAKPSTVAQALRGLQVAAICFLQPCEAIK